MGAALLWAESEPWLQTDAPAAGFPWPVLPRLCPSRPLDDCRSVIIPDVERAPRHFSSSQGVAPDFRADVSASGVKPTSAPCRQSGPCGSFLFSLILHAALALGAIFLLPGPVPEHLAQPGGHPVELDVLVVGIDEADALFEGARPQPVPAIPVSVPEAPPEPSLALPMPDLPAVPIFPKPDRTAGPELSQLQARPIARHATTPRRQPMARNDGRPKARPQAVSTARKRPEALGERGEGEASRNSIAQRRGGSGGAATTAGSSAMTSYRSRLVAHLTRYKNYPEQAQERGIGGRNAVTLTLSREGRVLSAGLSVASGHSILDSATLAAVRRAQPFPAIPEGGPNSFILTIGLRYDLR